MKDRPVSCDERTVVVENASYRWAYLLLTFGLLAVVAYRSLLYGESSWDLLALVVLGGLVASLYQAVQGVITRQWMLVAAISLVVAAAVAVVVRLLMP